MEIKINEQLFELLLTEMKFVLYVGLLKEPTLSELRDATRASWSTVHNIVPKLQGLGLIEVQEEKTRVKSVKKIAKLTDKGRMVFEKILELNQLLSEDKA
ncbi:hypothetical protein [Sulfolobus acidocaldarius]|uniref:hypothetical protein n=1 Tax=Sulfolobus acidocaldarius TaxID=2285 RepID=UPI0007833F3A|nr:hypothetical protein [Sulfolobus acidocaldarius]